MNKTVFRFFFDFMDGQEKWLNRMAERGYRLTKCGKMTYTFEPCEPSEYQYAIEFVADRGDATAKDYRNYLESMGFRTFTKNVNLAFTYGKVKWRPYARGTGQWATSPGGFNKELLVLEKKRDGKPFELHTNVQDKLVTYKAVRKAYAWAVLGLFLLNAMTFIPDISTLSETGLWVLRAVVLIFLILFSIPTWKYSLWVSRLKANSEVFQ